MSLAIQQGEVSKKLSMMLRGEDLIVEGIMQYKIYFDRSGVFWVNGYKISSSVKDTFFFLWHFNFRYMRRKESIQRKYWSKHLLDITKYFPEPVHPDIFEKFSEKNKSMIYGYSYSERNFCTLCAAVITECPRDHHPACPSYLNQDEYPKYEYKNPLGNCPECQSDDGLSIDSCREMALSHIDCADCDFYFEGNCSEATLIKRFKKNIVIKG